MASLAFIHPWQIMTNGSGPVSGNLLGFDPKFTDCPQTHQSETINWVPPIISSKEPRFGRRIDPVTNTFENRLTQVKRFEIPVD